jgi:hypothetical protein
MNSQKMERRPRMVKCYIVHWSKDEYENDLFLGHYNEEPFEVEAETYEEATDLAYKEAQTRFSETHGSADCSQWCIEKIVEKKE